MRSTRSGKLAKDLGAPFMPYLSFSRDAEQGKAGKREKALEYSAPSHQKPIDHSMKGFTGPSLTAQGYKLNESIGVLEILAVPPPRSIIPGDRMHPLSSEWCFLRGVSPHLTVFLTLVKEDPTQPIPIE
jgi:hypothetical protein